MNFNNFSAHQGDVQIFGITEVPATAKKVAKSFIAKSEKSGHAHALCGDYEMYEVENGHVIEVGTDGATLNHTGVQNLTPEYWDKNEVTPIADHKPTILAKGVYFVGIQRKADPFAGVFKRVID